MLKFNIKRIRSMVPNYYYNNLATPRLVVEDIFCCQDELDRLPLAGGDREYLVRLQEVIGRYFHRLQWRSHLDGRGKVQGVCSVSNRYLNSQVAYYQFLMPLLGREIRIAADVSNRDVVQVVHAYCKHFFKQLGPFQLACFGFMKETIVRAEKGLVRFFDFRSSSPCIKLPYLPGDFIIEQVEIQYSPKLGRLDVVCELSCPGITLKDISLDEVIKNNPRFDFGRAALELPNTIGGRYIRKYIFDRVQETY